MTEVCYDPLRDLVERLCCQVYLDAGGNVRLGFSRRHDLTAMMTAQGIVRSYAGQLRDRLRQIKAASDKPCPKDAPLADYVAMGPFCPLV